MKAAFYTLGCKVNQNETGALQRMFSDAGYTIVPHDTKDADVYVVNSCTVTAGGDAKSRQWLRRARRANPNAVTVLTGCFPQAFPKQAVIPEADVVTGTAHRARLLQDVKAFMQSHRQVVDIAAHGDGIFEELPTAQTERTRAFCKIQDGCNRRCAYCIIPTARGAVRSRPQQSILKELQTLAEEGFAEVVLTGINLPSYGQDTGTDLAEIVAAGSEIEGIRRIRLSSLDPDLVTDDLIARFAKVPKLCPHFHLSLQSGCDATLRRMRRPYNTAMYRAAAQKLRHAFPNCGLTTDVIVGFPGENEAEFSESLAFVREMEFLRVHVFPFSPRPGTPAAEFADQVPNAQKQARVHALQAAANGARDAWLLKQRGQTAIALLETAVSGGYFTGYTESYIPVRVKAIGAKGGDIVPLRLTKPENGIFDAETI